MACIMSVILHASEPESWDLFQEMNQHNLCATFPDSDCLESEVLGIPPVGNSSFNTSSAEDAPPLVIYFVANYPNYTLYKYDVKEEAVTPIIPVPGNPDSLYLSPDGKKMLMFERSLTNPVTLIAHILDLKTLEVTTFDLGTVIGTGYMGYRDGGPAGSYPWAPSSDRILFYYATWSSSWDYRNGILEYDLATGGARILKSYFNRGNCYTGGEMYNLRASYGTDSSRVILFDGHYTCSNASTYTDYSDKSKILLINTESNAQSTVDSLSCIHSYNEQYNKAHGSFIVDKQEHTVTIASPISCYPMPCMIQVKDSPASSCNSMQYDGIWPSAVSPKGETYFWENSRPREFYYTQRFGGGLNNFPASIYALSPFQMDAEGQYLVYFTYDHGLWAKDMTTGEESYLSTLFPSEYLGGVVGVHVKEEEPGEVVVVDANCMGSGLRSNIDPCVIFNGESKSYALGQDFKLQLYRIDEDGNPTPVSGLFEITDQMPSNSQYPITLFPNRVIFFFGPNPDIQLSVPNINDGIIDVMTVHLGETTITVKDIDEEEDPNFDDIVIHASVIRPASLGTGPPDYDGIIVSFSDFSGIPPQYIKGQIKTESSFNDQAYRYEMRTVDVAGVGMDALRERMETQQMTSKYNGYLRSTNYPSGYLSEGYRLNSYDLCAQNIYTKSVTDENGQHCVPVACENVSIGQLFLANAEYNIPDEQSNYNPTVDCPPVIPGYTNWCDPTCFDFVNGMSFYCQYILNHGDDYIAQTTAAASWGLLQVLYYDTAMGMQNWNGPNDSGEMNPSFLWNPSTSLDLGMNYLIAQISLRGGHYQCPCPECITSSFSISNKEHLKTIFRIGFQYYNNPSDGTASYGNVVLGFAENYYPLMP